MSAVHVLGHQRSLDLDEDVAVVVLREASVRRGVGTLRRDLASTLDSGVSTVVIDVSGVQDLSSVVVGLLLRVKRCCRARGGRVVLRGLNRVDLHVMHRTGLSSLFEIETPAPAPAPAPEEEVVITAPVFTAELTEQVQLALAEQRAAEQRGDTEAAEVAAGRVQDLRELHARAQETALG